MQLGWWFWCLGPMFLGSRNQMALFILCCLWPWLISGLWKGWNGSLSCLPIAGMSYNFMISYLRSWSIPTSLAVCLLAKYGCIMFAAMSRKHVLGHNFCIKAHRMMILVSWTMFLESKNQMALFMLCCIWPCLISGLWKGWNGSLSCLPKEGMSKNFKIS